MKYDCLIIDDEQILADNTCEYFNMFNLKTKAVYSKLAAFVFCGKIRYIVIVDKDLFLLQNNEGKLEYYDK